MPRDTSWKSAGRVKYGSSFAKAVAKEANFEETKLMYADFSSADVESANFKKADLMGANLHALNDNKANWNGANKKQVKLTDKDRLEAETWKIPD